MVISGYKPFEVGVFKKDDIAISFIKKAIRRNLETLMNEGLEWVIISGQLGTELWAAEVVFDMQIEGYEQLQLAVITPFYNQEQTWNDQNKEWYEFVISQADFVDSVSRKNYESPWQFRLKNQFLIEKSDAMILFYDSDREGSPKYLYEAVRTYQEKYSYSLHFITFSDLESLFEEEQFQNRQDD